MSAAIAALSDEYPANRRVTKPSVRPISSSQSRTFKSPWSRRSGREIRVGLLRLHSSAGLARMPTPSKCTVEQKTAKESAKEWGVNSGFLRDGAGRKRRFESECSTRISRGECVFALGFQGMGEWRPKELRNRRLLVRPQSGAIRAARCYVLRPFFVRVTFLSQRKNPFVHYRFRTVVKSAVRLRTRTCVPSRAFLRDATDWGYFRSIAAKQPKRADSFAVIPSVTVRKTVVETLGVPITKDEA